MTILPHRRLSGLRRGVVVCGLALSVGTATDATSPAASAPLRQPSTREVVALLGPQAARVAPRPRSRRIESVAARRPLTGVRTVLPVLGRGGRDNAWLRVRLPGRPNSHSGWISPGRTTLRSTRWSLRVDLASRRVLVYRDGRAVRRYRAVIGKASTPTPRGSFFVEEALALAAGEAGAPFALATSARSNVLQEFDGGPGQIALHGTRHLSGALGSASSHGCIRVSTRAIAWLASRIGAGVPVTISRRQPRPRLSDRAATA